jgi:hypothetical protein
MGAACARCIPGAARAYFVDAVTKKFAGIIHNEGLQMDVQ